MKVWVDDIRNPPDETWAIAHSYETAISCLRNGNVDEISLDHDLGEDKDGYDIAKFMAREDIWPAHIQIHTMNPVGRENIYQLVKRYAPEGTLLTVKIGGAHG